MEAGELVQRFMQKYRARPISRKALHKTDRSMYDELRKYPKLFDKLVPSGAGTPREGLDLEEVERIYKAKYGNKTLERKWLHDHDRGMYERLKNCDLLDRHAPIRDVNSEDCVKEEFSKIKNFHLLSRTELRKRNCSLYERARNCGLLDRLIEKKKGGVPKPDRNDLIREFKSLPEEDKRDRETMEEKHGSLFYKLKRAGLLPVVMPPTIKRRKYECPEELIAEFRKKFGNERIPKNVVYRQDAQLAVSLRIRGLLQRVTSDSYWGQTRKTCVCPTEKRLEWIESLKPDTVIDSRGSLTQTIIDFLPELTELAKSFARKYRLDLDDLISEATVAILEIDYDPEEARKNAVSKFYKMLRDRKNMQSINLENREGRKRKDLEIADYRELSPVDSAILKEEAAA